MSWKILYTCHQKNNLSEIKKFDAQQMTQGYFTATTHEIHEILNRKKSLISENFLNEKHVKWQMTKFPGSVS